MAPVAVLITVIVWAFGQIEGCSSPASMRCSSVIESLLRPLDPERISSRRRRVSVQPAENKLLAVVFTRVIRAAPFNVPDVRGSPHIGRRISWLAGSIIAIASHFGDILPPVIGRDPSQKLPKMELCAHEMIRRFHRPLG